MQFAPSRVHELPARRPSEYYVRRLQEGVRAFRGGIRNTPLTRTLERWMDHHVVFRVGNQDVPGALDSYARIFWEYVDAIDAEDDLHPYRFQKVGEMWDINYAVNGVVKRGVFKNYRGLQHYAQLLASPHKRIDSVVLAGKADTQTLSIIAGERQFLDNERHDEVSIETYKRALELLEEQHHTAKLKGDSVEIERLEGRIDSLVNDLWPGKTKGTKLNFNTLRRQTIGKSKTETNIHDAVGTAMRRAIATLIDGKRGKMVELARFLEMTVNPDGHGFAYRPLAPEPEWLL